VLCPCAPARRGAAVRRLRLGRPGSRPGCRRTRLGHV